MKGCMRTRELSHLAQTAVESTLGFKCIVQQAQYIILKESTKRKMD